MICLFKKHVESERASLFTYCLIIAAEGSRSLRIQRIGIRHNSSNNITLLIYVHHIRTWRTSPARITIILLLLLLFFPNLKCPGM